MLRAFVATNACLSGSSHVIRSIDGRVLPAINKPQPLWHELQMVLLGMIASYSNFPIAVPPHKLIMGRPKMIQDQLSHHILPNAATMLGVCLAGIGLVKLAEVHFGPSHVDEYLALNSVSFLISCLCSYTSIRHSKRRQIDLDGLEQIADVFFVIGLMVMTLISVTFAYEFI